MEDKMKRKKVVVTIEGGIVQDVRFDNGIEIELHVVDTDIFEDPADVRRCKCGKIEKEHSHQIYRPQRGDKK